MRMFLAAFALVAVASLPAQAGGSKSSATFVTHASFHGNFGHNFHSNFQSNFNHNGFYHNSAFYGNFQPNLAFFGSSYGCGATPVPAPVPALVLDPFTGVLVPRAFFGYR